MHYSVNCVRVSIFCSQYGKLIYMKVRYTYRLRPGKQAERYLLAEWDACRYVWNQMVEESQRRYENGQTFGPNEASKHLTHLRHTVKDENGALWLAVHSSVPQQQIVRGFSSSRKKALLDRKNKKHIRSGLLRYKSRRYAQPTLNYVGRAFGLVEVSGVLRLKLTKGVTIPVVWSRRLPSVPTSVRVYRKPDGKWFASFVVETTPECDTPNTGSVVGIDWGVQETATTVTVNEQGEVRESKDLDMPFGAYERKYEKPLAEAQRRMARRYQKDKRRCEQSRGYKKALRQYRELKRRSTAQRKDAANKWAVKVCRNSDAIASEDFKPKFLSRTTMASKAQDAAIGQLIDTLERQAVKRGRRFVKVNPAYTTQDCSNCGARAKHRLGLQDRVYKCEHCGFVLDRDRNSAINMLIGAGFIPGPIGTLSRSDAAVHGRAVPEKVKIPQP